MTSRATVDDKVSSAIHLYDSAIKAWRIISHMSVAYGGPGGHASFQFGSSYLRASSCQFLSSHLRHSSSALVVMPVAVLRHASSCLRTSVTSVAVFESPSFQYFSVLTPVTYPRQSSRQLLSSIIPVRGCPRLELVPLHPEPLILHRS